MEMKRREFLVRSIAGMGGVLLGSGCMDAAQQKPTKHDPYELVPLGKTGIKVSRVGPGHRNAWRRPAVESYAYGQREV